MELQASSDTLRKARDLAQAGDYDRAVAIASMALPEMGSQLEQFRIHMRAYEEARVTAEWRGALRSLADARIAALAAGLPEFVEVARDRLTSLMQHEVRSA